VLHGKDQEIEVARGSLIVDVEEGDAVPTFFFSFYDSSLSHLHRMEDRSGSKSADGC
jgi:hypothetical protein